MEFAAKGPTDNKEASVQVKQAWHKGGNKTL